VSGGGGFPVGRVVVGLVGVGLVVGAVGVATVGAAHRRAAVDATAVVTVAGVAAGALLALQRRLHPGWPLIVPWMASAGVRMAVTAGGFALLIAGRGRSPAVVVCVGLAAYLAGLAWETAVAWRYAERSADVPAAPRGTGGDS